MKYPDAALLHYQYAKKENRQQTLGGWVVGRVDAAVPTRGHNVCVHAVCGMKLAAPGNAMEPRGLPASQSRPSDIFSTAAVPGRNVDVCVASSIAAAAPGDAALAAFDRKLSYYRNESVELRQQGIHCRHFFGQRMDDRTQASLERFSTQQTLPPAGTGSRCRRNHFSAGGNTRSKSLFHGGEQPWHKQFCQAHRHGQNGFLLVSLIEPCTTGDMSPFLTVDPATTTVPTPRLTQQYQTMTTTSPHSPGSPPVWGRLFLACDGSPARPRGPAPS